MTPAPSDADKPASGPTGAKPDASKDSSKPDASRSPQTGPGVPGQDSSVKDSPVKDGAVKAGSGAPVAPAPSAAPKAAAPGETAKPATTTSGTPGQGPSATSPGLSSATGAKAEPPKPAASGSAGLSSSIPAGSGAPKAEPLKSSFEPTGAKTDAGKADAGKTDTAKGTGTGTGTETRPGGPAGPVGNAAVTAGPILDLKATRVPDAPAKEPAKEAPKDASKGTPASSATSTPGQAKPAGSVPSAGTSPAAAAAARGPAAAATLQQAGTTGGGKPDASKTDAPKTDAPKTDAFKTDASRPGVPKADALKTGSAPSALGSHTDSPKSGGKSGAGFGSVATAGLLGGVIGAGLLFAVEKAGIVGAAGPETTADPKVTEQIAALDKRIATLAPKDALTTLESRVAAAEATAKQADEKAANAGKAEGSSPASVPPDFAAKLDSLDQRVAALQEEPGREGGPTGTSAAQVESARQISELDARVKALESNAGGGEAGKDASNGAAQAAAQAASQALGKDIAALKDDVQARTQKNTEAVTALGQRLDGLQKSLDDQVKAAAESAQAATEASRKAAEANRSQAAEASKAVDQRLAEQGDKIAALDKGLADRAPAATVQAALRVVVADRIASALASGAPYAEPLSSLTKLDPKAQDQTAALTPFAEKGAPTANQLAGTFRGIAASIAQARQAAKTKAAQDSGDFRTKLLSMADGLVQVRRVEPGQAADGPAAAPEEAVQAALDRGDIEGAASAFDALPAEAKAQAGDFGKTLAARAKAAQAARALTASAFGALPAPGSAQ